VSRCSRPPARRPRGVHLLRWRRRLRVVCGWALFVVLESAATWRSKGASDGAQLGGRNRGRAEGKKAALFREARTPSTNASRGFVKVLEMK